MRRGAGTPQPLEAQLVIFTAMLTILVIPPFVMSLIAATPSSYMEDWVYSSSTSKRFCFPLGTTDSYCKMSVGPKGVRFWRQDYSSSSDETLKTVSMNSYVDDFCALGNIECKEWKTYRDMLTSAVPPLIIGAVCVGIALFIGLISFFFCCSAMCGDGMSDDEKKRKTLKKLRILVVLREVVVVFGALCLWIAYSTYDSEENHTKLDAQSTTSFYTGSGPTLMAVSAGLFTLVLLLNTFIMVGVNSRLKAGKSVTAIPAQVAGPSHPSSGATPFAIRRREEPTIPPPAPAPPSSGYGAGGYGQPPVSYGAPSSGYGQPPVSYGAPSSGYSQPPPTTYGGPSYGGGYGEPPASSGYGYGSPPPQPVSYGYDSTYGGPSGGYGVAPPPTSPPSQGEYFPSAPPPPAYSYDAPPPPPRSSGY